MKKLILGASIAATLLGIGAIGANYRVWVQYPPLRAPINNLLKDPASTQFKNEKIASNGWICGELNSKNGSGGYAGYKRYISGGELGPHYLEGLGVAGEWSNKDSSALLEQESMILNSFIEMRNSNPSLQAPATERVRQMAKDKFFADRWEQVCV